MSTTETTPTSVCPECGAQLDATTKLYWSYLSGRWVMDDADNESFSITCANDHDAEALLPDDEVNDLCNGLSDAVIGLGRGHVADVEGYALRCGTPSAFGDERGAPPARLLAELVIDFSPTAIRVHFGGDEEMGLLIAGCSDEELAEAARDFLDSGGAEPWGAFDAWVRRIAEDAYLTHSHRHNLRQAETQ